MSGDPRRAPSAAGGGPLSHAIFRLAKLHRARAAQLLREIGLHPGQELVMMRLWDCGPLRQADLATEFDTDSASMTRTVQRLERAGYVRRVPCPTDGRATLVEPTTASVGLRPRVEEIWSQLEQDMVRGLTAAQCREALECVRLLESNLAGAQACADGAGRGYLGAADPAGRVK